MSEPVYCDDCNATVRIERNASGQLKAKCACDSTRNVRVSKVLPEGWR